MKKLAVVVLIFVLAAAIWPGSASAANSLQQGKFGFNVDVNDDFIIAGKYLVTSDIAVLAGFGIGIKGADADGTDIGITGGIRKYMKVDDFAPFVGGTFFYSTTEDGDTENLSLMGEAGVEYFLHKQFSIEGKVGFGYTSQETKTPGTPQTGPGGIQIQTENTVKTTNIGTERFVISFNYYF